MRGGLARWMRQVFVLAVTAGLSVGVAREAIRGPHGLAANQALAEHIKTLKSELEAMKAQRGQLERDAALLGPKAAAEPALLDQEARSLLDYADPSDIVIVHRSKGE